VLLIGFARFLAFLHQLVCRKKDSVSVPEPLPALRSVSGSMTLLSNHSVSSSSPYIRRGWAVREGVMAFRQQNVFRQLVIVAYHMSLLALVIHLVLFRGFVNCW
jgi:hypothetical protein